jgi:hypothetical protein
LCVGRAAIAAHAARPSYYRIADAKESPALGRTLLGGSLPAVIPFRGIFAACADVVGRLPGRGT